MINIQNFVHNWLLGGADHEVGLRLFMDYTNPSKPIARIVSKNPKIHLGIIKAALLKKAGLPYDIEIQPNSIQKTSLDEPKRKIRSDWPFLADPECPPELKLLISEKITAYSNCIQFYNKLTDAGSLNDQLLIVGTLVSNFINNHEIYQELNHYKGTGKVLGKHAIFEQFKRIKILRNLPTMDLFKKKKNLEHAIWRNESKIKNEKRNDLLPDRQNKVKELKLQLAEVNRLLE